MNSYTCQDVNSNLEIEANSSVLVQTQSKGLWSFMTVRWNVVWANKCVVWADKVGKKWKIKLSDWNDKVSSVPIMNRARYVCLDACLLTVGYNSFDKGTWVKTFQWTSSFCHDPIKWLESQSLKWFPSANISYMIGIIMNTCVCVSLLPVMVGINFANVIQ